MMMMKRKKDLISFERERESVCVCVCVHAHMSGCGWVARMADTIISDELNLCFNGSKREWRNNIIIIIIKH
jgi:hypothetical protein